MARYVHLLKVDSPVLAARLIEESSRLPGADVTVVLLEGVADPPPFPPGVHVRRLAADDLDYSSLLDLIFESDHVLTW
jgi:hypothetical protein